MVLFLMGIVQDKKKVRCFIGTITESPPFQLDTTTKLADPFSLQKVY